MRATATQIGKSKKERIDIDGETYLKSVNIGRWSYIVRVEAEGRSFVGHSGSLPAAEKWAPFPMVHDIELYPSDTPEARSAKRAKIAAYMAEGRGKWIAQRHYGRIFKIYRVPLEYTRTVIKIER